MTRTLEILERLVAFDTVSDRSNLALIDYVQDLLRAQGFAVTRVPDPTGKKAGLFASIGPEGAGVLLSAHTDVVPVAGQAWTREPFALTWEDDRLYGRGTTDMKGFLAAMLAAAERAAQTPLREPLKLAISYDEEVGCLGIAHMIGGMKAAIGLPRACIVGEPTQMQVAIGHKGKQALRAVCHGQAGHSAQAPQFTNALHLAAGFITELRRVQDGLAAHGAQDTAYDVPCSTVHVGRLAGGTALNIVPDRADMALEFRHLAADNPDDLLARIMAAAGRAAAPFGDSGQIEVEPLTAYPGLATAPDAPVVAWAQGLAGQTGTTKVGFGTEAGFFDALGIPSVVCGPGSMTGQGHKPDEFITRDQLEKCDSMLARLVASLG